MNIRKLDEGALEFRDIDRVLLGFPTGINTRRFSRIDTVALRKSMGSIFIGENPASPWPIEQFIEYQGKMVALGPWVEDSLPFDRVPLNPTVLLKLMRAIRSLKSGGFPLNGLYSRAIRWLPDTNVLLYPPKLAEWMREFYPPEKWIHPDLKGEGAWSFSLGVLSWTVLTGKDPFRNENAVLRRERIRRAVLPSLPSLIQELDGAAADTIIQSLTGSKRERPSVDEWDELLRRWTRTGIKRRLTARAVKEGRRKAVRQSRSAESVLIMRRWFRQFGWKLFSVLLIGVLIVVSAFSPLKKALATPITAGMAPIQIAATYYEAINSMQSDTLNAILARSADRQDLRIVNMLYVSGMVRESYEGIGTPPRASDWIRDGRPELPPGLFPWGVSDLRLEILGKDRVVARYLFWAPPSEEAVEMPVPIARIDILTFAQRRKSWKISGIDRRVIDAE